MARDDGYLYVIKRDLSGGVNTRQSSQIIQDNQAVTLQNVFIDTAGERSVRSGLTLIQDLGNTAGTGLYGLEPDGSTNQLIANSGQFIKWWSGSGSFSSIASLASIGFDLSTTMVKALESDAGDVCVISNGSDNVIRLDPVTPEFQDLGDTNTSPPKTTVMTYFRDRLWCLDDQKLYYSGAVPSDYSATFDRTNNYYNIPVGTEMGLVGLRDAGLIVVGSDEIWAFNPSLVPAATDKPEKLLNIGCVAQNTIQQVGDDVLFLATDGVRGVFRTQLDKLQQGQSFPLSWGLKKEFEAVNPSYIHLATAIYFDNKYILSLATGSSTYNNTLWIYYPAFNGWVTVTGINIAKFATLQVSGENRLYGIDSNDGSVYRVFYGTDDNGTAITYTEESRAEDFKEPIKNKVGGEFRVKVRGQNAVITAYADVDGAGYVAMNGDDITLAAGGLSFPLDFPFNFDESETTGIWHLDNLGSYRRIQFKIVCNTQDATFRILESIATTFLEEYQSEV